MYDDGEVRQPGSMPGALRAGAPHDEREPPVQVLAIGETGLTAWLQRCRVATAFNVSAVGPRQGADRLRRGRPDLVLLQVTEGAASLTLLEQLRAASSVGIIALGSGDAIGERVAALEAGADDHVTFPIDARELVARLHALLRRTRPAPGPFRVRVGGHWLVIDPTRHQVTCDGRPVHLTNTELGLLEVLVTNPGTLLTHRELLQQVWGERYGTESNYLRVYVAQLRKKLGDRAADPMLIETEPGIGYRWVAGATAEPSAEPLPGVADHEQRTPAWAAS